jgi:hypothetical protein
VTARTKHGGLLLTFLAKIGWRENTGHWMILGHFLEDLDEEANLHLGRLL